MSRTEPVNIKNSLGGDIAAVVHYPDKVSGKLAILCPGYLDSKDYAHLASLANTFAERGYTAVRFDPTGTWESEGDISQYSVSQYLKDIESVLEYMLHEGEFRQILLGGHSKGGFVSILYAVRDTRISTVLGIMAPYSLFRTVNEERNERWKKEGFRVSGRDVPGGEGKREFRVPYSHVEDQQTYDLLGEVGKLHAPLILVAGERDVSIPPEDVKLIFDRANEPKKMIVMKGIGHDYRRHPEEIEKVNGEIIKALEP